MTRSTMPRAALIIGPPAAGKSTLGKEVAAVLSAAFVSVGERLRLHTSSLTPTEAASVILHEACEVAVRDDLDWLVMDCVKSAADLDQLVSVLNDHGIQLAMCFGCGVSADEKSLHALAVEAVERGRPDDQPLIVKRRMAKWSAGKPGILKALQEQQYVLHDIMALSTIRCKLQRTVPRLGFGRPFSQSTIAAVDRSQVTTSATCMIHYLKMTPATAAQPRHRPLPPNVGFCTSLERVARVKASLREVFPAWDSAALHSLPATIVQSHSHMEWIGAPGRYLATRKCDGVRYMLLVLDGLMFLIDRKHTIFEFTLDAAISLGDRTLLDGELIVYSDRRPRSPQADNNDVPSLRTYFLVFDALALPHRVLWTQPFDTRLTALNTLPLAVAGTRCPIEERTMVASIKVVDSCRVQLCLQPVSCCQLLLKPHVEPSRQAIENLLSPTWFETDGVVFTPRSLPYACGADPLLFKWQAPGQVCADLKVNHEPFNKLISGKVTSASRVAILKLATTCGPYPSRTPSLNGS